MGTNVVKLFLVVLIIVTCACTAEQNGKVTQSRITNKNEAKQLNHKQQEWKRNMADKADTTPVKRKYKFPSMMIKRDMYHCEQEDDHNCMPLLETLVVNRWAIIRDKYGRQCKYSSPEITYAELREYLHFNDSDVAYLVDPKPGEPQAIIKTEWLMCNIIFLHEIYDLKNTSVKVKAVLIDNEVVANSKREEEYLKDKDKDKDKGIIRTILDWFKVVHQ